MTRSSVSVELTVDDSGEPCRVLLLCLPKRFEVFDQAPGRNVVAESTAVLVIAAVHAHELFGPEDLVPESEAAAIPNAELQNAPRTKNPPSSRRILCIDLGELWFCTAQSCRHRNRDLWRCGSRGERPALPGASDPVETRTRRNVTQGRNLRSRSRSPNGSARFVSE